MSDPGKEYALFLQSITESSVIEMDLPFGEYIVKHVNPLSGELVKEESIQVGEARAVLNISLPDAELALDIRGVE